MTFGGSAWSRDEQSGRWYLHSFYPEQPDLDWRNPEVVEAMQGVVRFWRDRGTDGFRLDAIDRLATSDQGNTLLLETAPASLWTRVSPTAIPDRVSQNLKRAFDPLAILNPGILGTIN